MNEMDSRKWIEFGKMFNAFVEMGYEIDINSFTSEVDCNEVLFYVTLTSDSNSISDDFLHSTPYDAIKSMYFPYVLNIDNVENIDLDIDTDLLQTIYDLSDAEGITVDEFIMKALEKELKKPTYAACCYNCEHLKMLPIINAGHCKIHGIDINYNKTCNEYIPKDDLN